MDAWENLSRVFRLNAPQIPDFESDVSGFDDAVELVPEVASGPEYDIFGATFAIEYIDAVGNESRRRITLHDVSLADNGMIYLESYCHERKAHRTFRFDRITCVIDMDGVVWEPTIFFGGDLDFSIGDPTPVPMDPIVACRKNWMSEIVLLSGMSRSDGRMLDCEVDQIIAYIHTRARDFRVKLEFSDNEVLRKFVRCLRPDEFSLDRALKNVSKLDNDAKVSLVTCAADVMNADGSQHPAEFDYLLKLRDSLQ